MLCNCCETDPLVSPVIQPHPLLRQYYVKFFKLFVSQIFRIYAHLGFFILFFLKKCMQYPNIFDKNWWIEHSYCMKTEKCFGTTCIFGETIPLSIKLIQFIAIKSNLVEIQEMVQRIGSGTSTSFGGKGLLKHYNHLETPNYCLSLFQD